jgi:hypothetical protein
MPLIRAYPQSASGESLGPPRDVEVAQIPRIGEHIDLNPQPGSVYEVTVVLHTPWDKEKLAAIIWAKLDSDFIGPR